MDTRHIISDEWLDTAACEALSANSPAESAAYQQRLATLSADERELDRSLRETVARLATASPYMEPSADLRGRILQATAPQTFRMEDYRRVNSEGSKFFKWGFYAAILFLMAASWYNMWMSNKLTLANNSIAQANGAIKTLSHEVQQRDSALATFVNPKTRQVILVEGNKPVAKFLVDDAAKTAVGLVARESLPNGGGTGQLTMQENGKLVQYQAVLLPDPGNFLQAPSGPIQTVYQGKDPSVDNEHRVERAIIVR